MFQDKPGCSGQGRADKWASDQLSKAPLALSVLEEQAAMAQEIEHTHLPIRGLNIHVAQVGKGES